MKNTILNEYVDYGNATKIKLFNNMTTQVIEIFNNLDTSTQVSKMSRHNKLRQLSLSNL